MRSAGKTGWMSFSRLTTSFAGNAKRFSLPGSLGGALALQLAVQRDDVKKLFLLAPAVYPTLLFKIAVIVLIPLLRVLGFRYWTHVAGDVKRVDGFELGYGTTALCGLLELSKCMAAARRVLPET